MANNLDLRLRTTARDFRKMTIGDAYKSSEVKDAGNGAYIGKIDAPAKGWTAFFVEMTYDMPGGVPMKLTSAVRVLPDTLPSAPYQKKPLK